MTYFGYKRRLNSFRRGELLGVDEHWKYGNVLYTPYTALTLTLIY